MEYKNGDVVELHLNTKTKYVVINDVVTTYRNKKYIRVKMVYNPIYYTEGFKTNILNLKFLRKVNLEEISGFKKNLVIRAFDVKDFISNNICKDGLYGVVTGNFEFYRGDVLIEVIDKNYQRYKFLSRSLSKLYKTHEEYEKLSKLMNFSYEVF